MSTIKVTTVRKIDGVDKLIDQYTTDDLNKALRYCKIVEYNGNDYIITLNTYTQVWYRVRINGKFVDSGSYELPDAEKRYNSFMDLIKDPYEDERKPRRRTDWHKYNGVDERDFF